MNINGAADLARGQLAGGGIFSYCFWTFVAYLETCLQVQTP